MLNRKKKNKNETGTKIMRIIMMFTKKYWLYLFKVLWSCTGYKLSCVHSAQVKAQTDTINSCKRLYFKAWNRLTSAIRLKNVQKTF